MASGETENAHEEYEPRQRVLARTAALLGDLDARGVPAFVTVPVAARLLCCGQNYVRELLKRRVIQGVKVGNRKMAQWLVPTSFFFELERRAREHERER